MARSFVIFHFLSYSWESLVPFKHTNSW
jgi:hypothetical protein